MTPGTRNDGLRLELAAAEVACLRWDQSGPLSGVQVTAAAGINLVGGGVNAGTGRIIAGMTGATPTLAWQAPGSGTPGSPCLITADGSYMLEDGEAPSRWIRVTVTTAYLPSSGEGLVTLSDFYNAMGPNDVTAAQATAGNTQTVTFTLTNVTPLPIVRVFMWLDGTASGLANLFLSSDNVHFGQPASKVDAGVLSWASIAAGASVNVYVKRVITAGALANPELLNILQYIWIGY